MEWNKTNWISSFVLFHFCAATTTIYIKKGKSCQFRTSLSQSFVRNKMMLKLQSNFKVALRIYVSEISFRRCVALLLLLVFLFLFHSSPFFMWSFPLLPMSLVKSVCPSSAWILHRRLRMCFALLCYALSLLFNVCECLCSFCFFLLLFIVLTLSS